MHKLLLFAKRRTCQSCFTYQCVTRRRMKTCRCLTKFREEKYEGSLQQSFFSLLKREELWRMAFRYSSDDSRCHELWKKKGRRRRKLGGFHPEKRGWRGKKKEQTIIKARGVPAMIFIALCSYSAWGGEEEKWIKPWISIPLLIGTEVGFYLLKNNIPETYFGKEEEVWLGWRL